MTSPRTPDRPRQPSTRVDAGRARPRRRRLTARQARAHAKSRLSRFRQGSMLAVGATALLVLLLGGDAATGAPPADRGPAAAAEPVAAAGRPAQEPAPAEDAGEPAGEPAAAQVDSAAVDTAGADTSGPALDSVAASPAESAREATGTLRELGLTFYNALPAMGIALALLLVAGLLARLVRIGLRAALSSWERADATAALAAIFIWLLALGGALSVVAGDARALVGSIGLFGLALSWALQTPIESFTGWLLNSFRSYYRVGDRIAVGDVFGDVARIDFLTTSVFEAGGPDKQVQAAQSTGALVTFPNAEILRSNVVNYTRDFPYVYDELTVAVANESDIPGAVALVESVAADVVGDRMRGEAEAYAELLKRARLAWDVTTRPEVYVAARDSWTALTIRYVVPVREMRKWSTRLQLALNEALAQPDVAARIFPAYTRTQVQPLPTPPWAHRDETEREQ